MADVPRDEMPGDARPWEEPGAVRRDCEPHRGKVLSALALAACMIIPAAPVSLVIGAWAWAEARRDLREIAAGRMDPAGADDTEQARRDGLAALVLGACLTAGGVLFLLAALFLDVR